MKMKHLLIKSMPLILLGIIIAISLAKKIIYDYRTTREILEEKNNKRI